MTTTEINRTGCFGAYCVQRPTWSWE